MSYNETFNDSISTPETTNEDLYSVDFYEDNNYKSNICQFTVEGNNFFPSAKTVKKLPSGYYKIRKDYSRGLFLRKTNVNLNKLILLDNNILYNKIIDDLVKFWSSKEEYLKRGKIYRRNILLHSAPGMGKTSLINLIIEDLIKNRNGFVISITDPSDISNFNEMMLFIRSSMPNQPIIVTIEDIDNFINGNSSKSIETELLNILDGVDTYDNLVIIATTNYPEQLTERYINRPSRFNRVIEIPYPDENTRREFLIKTNLKEDIDKINIDEWVKKTEGYSIDLLKELSESVFICGNTEEETFKMLNEMMSKKVVKNESVSSLSQKIGFSKISKLNE